MKSRSPRAISNLASVKITQAPFDREDNMITETDALILAEKEARPRLFSLGRLLLYAFGLLVFLALGLWVDELIRNLFSRTGILGWLALITAVIALMALVLLAIREFYAFYRLSAVEHIRDMARDSVTYDDMRLARQAVDRMLAFSARQPQTARGRKALQAIRNEIIDGRALIHLAEAEILRPLDHQARNLVLAAARRVSIVTAISPRALVDLVYVFYESSRLIRALATLYGCRPGRFGLFTIGRLVLSHLAITGSIALSDGLAQQLIGHGLAARLSARLGEGMINGLMTARIGIAAMDVLRPFPFDGEKRPGMKDLATDLARFGKQKK